jgi:hypothetical protein
LLLGKEITKEDLLEAYKVTLALSAFTTTSKNILKWTLKVIVEMALIGSLGPISIRSPLTIIDKLE